MPSHFDQRRKNWSARKHAILTRYLGVFSTALSRMARDRPIWYVDGYAGAGYYRDMTDPNHEAEPGSPVLAARIAAEKAIDLRCLNVEEDSDTFDSLRASTAEYPDVINMNGNFCHLVESILQTIGHSPALFFLDPFGTQELPMEGVIEQISRRQSETDILLRYPTFAVARLAGAYLNDLDRSESYATHLDRWFLGNEWRDIVRTHDKGAIRNQLLLHYYKRQIVNIQGGRIQFVADYPIKSIENDQVQYHMVFASGHRLGIKLMSDILYAVGLEYQSDKDGYWIKKAAAAGQLSMFDSAQLVPPDDSPDLVGRLMHAVQSIERPLGFEWTFEELHFDLAINQGWFAQFPEKHLREACKSLVALSRIERLSAGKAWDRKTRFRLRF